MRAVFALFRTTAKDFRASFPDLPWCVRLERGPIGGALHNHFVLAGLPEEAISSATCTTMMERWKEKFGGSESKIELFDPSQCGLDYLSKGLGFDPIVGWGGLNRSELDLQYSRAVWNPNNHFRTSVSN